MLLGASSIDSVWVPGEISYECLLSVDTDRGGHFFVGADFICLLRLWHSSHESL